MIWILIPIFVVPLVLLTFFLALSSCLGDPLRRGSGRSGGLLRPSYGRTYLNSISSGAWENVEMDRIERESDDDEFDLEEGRHEEEGML
ncbi:uncharacterized protein LAJ45_01380 [Morchella importuna]|uniref:Uncharacterized protein n=1 Tax=Morchella conica CCBAS932 TaxID=1392247 RepID=A0A3N4KDV0_9PEZI|nr:uncharacterized protein LAJ45_01380 [Morchella importuna]KAH8154849.1 hypothetical protein LAJ45_01380 [Morchella importuna]RPB07658.1 hypothetical protein P167DRAFT_539919 [Morchella conica CCBAS932]